MINMQTKQQNVSLHLYTYKYSGCKVWLIKSRMSCFSSKKTHSPPFWNRKYKTGTFFLKYRWNVAPQKWQKCTDSRFLSVRNEKYTIDSYFLPVRNAEMYWFMPSARKKWEKTVDSDFLTIRNGKKFRFILSAHQKWEKTEDSSFLPVRNDEKVSIHTFLPSEMAKTYFLYFLTIRNDEKV